MAARNTVADYKTAHTSNKLADATIAVYLDAASRVIDRLIGLGPSDDTLTDAELWLALYFATAEDRRKRAEGIPPASTQYELVEYKELLRATLGDFYPLLGSIDGDPPRAAQFGVISITC